MKKEILDEAVTVRDMKTDFDAAHKKLIDTLFRLLHDPIRHVYEKNTEEWSKYPATAVIPWSEGLVSSAFDQETYTFRNESKPWVIIQHEKASDFDIENLKKLVVFVNTQWKDIATFEAQYINDDSDLEIKVLFIQ